MSSVQYNTVFYSHLLHILCDGIVTQELGALPGIESLRVLQEGVLEGLTVHRKVLPPGAGFILVQTCVCL